MFWRSAFYWQVFLVAYFSAHLDSVPFIFFFPESSKTAISSRTFSDCLWHGFQCPSELAVLVGLVGFIKIKHNVENVKMWKRASVLPTLCSSCLWYGKVPQDLHEVPPKEKRRRISLCYRETNTQAGKEDMWVLALLYGEKKKIRAVLLSASSCCAAHNVLLIYNGFA